MTQNSMNTDYCLIRRYGKITTDFSPNDIVRLLVINYNSDNWHITLYRGEVFAITQVKD